MAKKHFAAQDIGSELLPIITMGIYRDPLDTLREYVQNAIDAGAPHIEIGITPDLASIRDDGHGMVPEVAERALRLGMSEKDPGRDVGFRGIGIYSGYNVCDRLEVYTCPASKVLSKLVFDFKLIRGRLAAEEARRMAGEAASLSLEELLSDAVWREDCDKCPFTGTGTQVLLIGLRGEVYERLTNWAKVKEYLQNAVPLEFSPSFRFKHEIEAHFRSQDHRVVDLELNVNGRLEHLYRPYMDNIFSHDEGIGPKFFTLANVLAGGKLGFAWVCLNDARRYLPDRVLRGLLIKKFGFSVGGREHFAQFFSRQVFNNRITGEIIVTHKKLIPNAARTEFEPNPTRDGLYVAMGQLASEISTWGNTIQEYLKAREELEFISPEVFNLAEQIPGSERDIQRLLYWNSLLESYGVRLNTHKGAIKKFNAELFDKTVTALAHAKETIAEILSTQQAPAQGRRRRIEEAVRLRASAPDAKGLIHAKDRPRALVDVLSLADLEMSDGLRVVFEYLDREVVRPKMSEVEYAQFLDGLATYLDESL